MKKLMMLGTFVLWLGYVSVQICPGQTAQVQNRQTKTGLAFAFVNVNVIPMNQEGVLEKQTVIVRNGKIVEIGSRESVKVPRDVKRINGKGKFLMPGLIDMHAHLNSPGEFPLYLANGVTTVYNLNGQPAHLLWRERINRGEMLGPTIYTCGPTIRTVQKPEEARQIVEVQAQLGYDSIKIYNGVSKEAYDVLIEEAKKHKMLIVGHIPRAPKFEDVMKSGQAIAHAEEFVYTFFNNNVDTQSQIPEAVKIVSDNSVPVILTLVAFDHIIKQAENLPVLLRQPEFKYLAPWVSADWQPGKNLYEKNFANNKGIAYLKKSIALQKKLVQAFREASVEIMVGTDAMNMGVVPGFSVHEEIRNLVEIGFSPFEAFQAATRVPAEFLRVNEFGTIAIGKRADLILVDGNPLADISRASRPDGVMIRGRWLTAKTLNQMLNEVPANYVKEEKFVKASFERETGKILNYLNEMDPFNNLLNEAVTNLVAEQGVNGFTNIVAKARSINPQTALVQERFINALGYRLKGQNKTKEAIEVFKYNVKAYPKSANTYDSLAEAYLDIGEKELAIRFYRKALEVDSNYPNAGGARDLLKKLEAETKNNSPNKPLRKD